MSANSNLHPISGEPSGEQLFFVIAIAFLALVAIIVAAAFLPVAAGVGLAMAAIVGAVGIVVRFLAGMLDG